MNLPCQSHSVHVSVPSAPQSVIVLRRGHDHILIEWLEPEEPNGVITGYEIGYSAGKCWQISTNIVLVLVPLIVVVGSFDVVCFP